MARYTGAACQAENQSLKGDKVQRGGARQKPISDSMDRAAAKASNTLCIIGKTKAKRFYGISESQLKSILR